MCAYVEIDITLNIDVCVCVCAQLDIYNVLCRDAILNVRICFIQEDN